MKAKTKVLPILVQSAVRGYLAPRLAQDAKIDLNWITRDISAKGWKADKQKIRSALLKETTGKMAVDADLGDIVSMLDSLDDVVAEVANSQTGEPLDDVDLDPGVGDPASAIDPVAPPPAAAPKPPAPPKAAAPPPPKADPAAPPDKTKDASPLDPVTAAPAPGGAPEGLMDFLSGLISTEDLSSVSAMFAAPPSAAPAAPSTPKGPKPGGIDAELEAVDAEIDAVDADPAAVDADPAAKDGGSPSPFIKAKEKPMPTITQPAMDAAIKIASDSAAKRAEASVIARLNAVRAAERAVRPYVGDLAIAQDTAEAVYRLALDTLGVDTKGVREIAALELVLSVQPKPGDAPARATRVAMDSSASADLAKRFPGVTSLRRN